jgi:hypothetical protein
MEYTVNGELTLSNKYSVRLRSDLVFVSPSSINVRISDAREKLLVEMKIEAEDDELAKEFAEIELSRITDLLSFTVNIPITQSRVNKISWVKNVENGLSIGCKEYLSLADELCLSVSPNDKGMAQLTSCLEKCYASDCLEVVNMWRVAMSKESAVEKYFSLYRLLEFLLSPRGIEPWIKTTDPNVQIYPKNSHRKQEHTIYTYLRDNIHFKREMKQFPIQDIQENVEVFQNLVRHCIYEKFSTDL